MPLKRLVVTIIPPPAPGSFQLKQQSESAAVNPVSLTEHKELVQDKAPAPNQPLNCFGVKGVTEFEKTFFEPLSIGANIVKAASLTHP